MTTLSQSRIPAFLRDIAPNWARRMAGRSDRGGVLTPPPPPRCPPGWSIGPPDFIGVGVQRGGTTRWFDLIASHPEVTHATSAKELHYFDRFYTGGFTAKDATAYQAHFPRDDRRKTGEWTPVYMSVPWIPPLLAQAAPNARLLVLVRDPVQRYISGLQHNARIAGEHGVPIDRRAPLEAFMRGFYHGQLAGLLEHFDRSRILVLQYERCVEEPLSELRRTFEFLDLSDLAPEMDVKARPNASHRERLALDAVTRENCARAYRDDVTLLAESFPEIDLGLWPNFAELAVES